MLHDFFPSMFSKGSHVGIIIPDTVAKEDRDLFESILTGMTSYQDQPEQSQLV